MRVALARFLLRLGSLVQSTAVAVMKPDDLVAFSRQTYARPNNVEAWAEDALVDAGLGADELDLLAAVPVKGGDLLLLGVGGGREAIPLARMGYRVTGVDFVAALAERARQNALCRGVEIETLVQEISQLDVPAGAYDVVWLSRSTYSCVPTRARRVGLVRRIARALKPGGCLVCQFHWDPRPPSTGRTRLLRLVAACTLGNLAYEEGDMLWGNIEFVHAFRSEDAVRSELAAGGLDVLDLHTDPASIRGRAVCRVRPRAGAGADSEEEGSE